MEEDNRLRDAGGNDFKIKLQNVSRRLFQAASQGNGDMEAFSDFVGEQFKLLVEETDEEDDLTGNEELTLTCPSTLAALSNDLVLKAVFKYLSLEDLKACKLQNRQWNSISSEVLNGGKRSTYVNTRKLRDLKNRRNSKSLVRDLMLCWNKSSGTWIASGVAMDCNVWDLSNSEVTNFLNRFGSRVKRLIIDYPAFPTFDVLGDLLTRDLPNLEYLYLKDIGDFPEEVPQEFITPLFPPDIRLLSLKVLKLPGKRQVIPRKHMAYLKVVRGIVPAATNLIRVENFDCRFTETLIQSNKIAVVQELDFMKASVNRSFAEANLSLSRLDITGLKEDASAEEKMSLVSLLIDLLKRIRNSLKELKIQPLAFLPGFMLPVLPEVKVLSLVQNECEEALAFLPHYSKAEKLFPTLQELRLDVGIWDEDSISMYFPDDSEVTFPQVEVLKISSSADYYGVLNIGSKFSNVTFLQIDCSKLFSVLKPFHFWNLPLRLKSLELREFSLQQVFEADSFFTGIHPVTCGKLRESERMDNVDPDIFRVKMSVCDFKDLKRLKLVLANISHQGGSAGALSKVTGWYAFNCMRDLQVIVSYDYRHSRASTLSAAVEAIGSFVTFIHEDVPGV